MSCFNSQDYKAALSRGKMWTVKRNFGVKNENMES